MFLGGVSSYDGNDGNDGHGRSLSVDEDIVSARDTFNTVVMVLSLAGSSLVLLTALMFPSIIRNKTLSFTIMMVSFNNWLTSIGNSFGFPKGDACVVQSIFILLGIKGSWLCVMLVCHQLRKIITTGKLALSSRQTVYVYIGYQICQILYTKALGYDFGNLKSSQGKQSCVYYDPNPSGESYFEEGVLGLLLFEYLMMIFVIYDIVLITRHVSDLKIKASTEFDKVNALKKSAWLYPLFMLVVWTPLTSLIIYMRVQSSNNFTSSPGLFAFLASFNDFKARRFLNVIIITYSILVVIHSTSAFKTITNNYYFDSAGQYTAEGTDSWAFGIPMVLGVKSNITNHLILGFEVGARYTFSDELDGSVPDDVGLESLSFGNINSNDWYVFTGFTLTYTFGQRPCYCNF